MQTGNDFIAAECHAATAETDNIGVGRMGADCYAVLCRQRQRFAHRQGITRMEATRDTRLVDKGHHGSIMPHVPVAIAFA